MRAKNNETSSRAKEAWKSFGIDWQLYGMGPLMSLGLLTCFITLMLSSTRTLAVVKPFYRIKKRKILFAFVIFLVFLAALLTTKFVIMSRLDQSLSDSTMSNSTLENLQGTPPVKLYIATTFLEQALTLLMVIVVVILSGISIKVLKSEGNEILGQQQFVQHRKATIMIIILSLALVVCNSIWISCIISINTQFLGETEQELGGESEGKYELSANENHAYTHDKIFISLLVTLIMITLNSCVNPIVYITKNSALNTYTKLHIRHMIDCFTNNTIYNSTNSVPRDIELNTHHAIEEN